MTEIAIRADQPLDVPTSRDQGVVQLAAWAQAADAAYRLAEALCSTSFAPAAYRGKPQEGAAAILAGAEVGLSPTAALRAFDNIQGTPAPKAMTLRAIVQGQGHEVRIDQSSAEIAVVSGRRKDHTDWQTSTWTIERAQQMGLLGKEQWKKQPAAMLVARATAEVCRWIASDAIMGMPYTAEEIRDDGPMFDPRPRPQRITAADILSSTEIEPAPEPAHPRELDPADGYDAVNNTDPDAPRTDAQKRHIFALLGERGITDRAQRLAGISKVIGREIASTNDLTQAEATQVIDSLQRAEAA